MEHAITKALFSALTIIAGGTVASFAQAGDHSHARTNDVRKAVEAAEAKFGSLFASGDIKGLAQLYAEDAEVMAPNLAPVTGRSAIQGFWQGARDSGVRKVAVKTLETNGTGGDTTYEVGTYTLYGSSDEVLDEGKYMVIWKREGKAWLLYRDIWNSNRK